MFNADSLEDQNDFDGYELESATLIVSTLIVHMHCTCVALVRLVCVCERERKGGGGREREGVRR